MPKLSIIIPTKNEENRIAKTLSNYGSYFESHKNELETEIIVVISGTNDDTAKIVSKYHKKYPFIKNIITPYDSGKGGAVALGFLNATGDYIGFADADGAVAASEAHRLFQFIKETPWLDGVIGSRDKDKTQMSFRRRLISGVFNFYTKIFFNLDYKDTQCGIKIFKKDVAKKLAGKLSNTGWAFDVNLLLISKHLNFQILERTVNWVEKKGSKFSLYEGIVGVFFEFLKLKKLEVSYKISEQEPDFINNIFEEEKVGKKNILIFAWRDLKHPEVGGSEIYMQEVAKRLNKDHNIVIFTSRPKNVSSKDNIDGVKIVRKGGRFSVYFWGFIYYLKYFRKDTDLIIDVCNGIPFFTPIFSAKPIILLVHHVHKKQWFKEFNFILGSIGYFIESFLLCFIYKSSTVVTVSPSSLEGLRKIGFPENHIYLAYNSIPSKVGGSYSDTEYPLLTYIGRIKAYKRIEYAIESVKTLKKEYPNIKLKVAGAGDHLDELKKCVQKNKLQDHVEFLGFISEYKKWEIMQKAWLFLMPSEKEGWGITILEAASCGTPAMGFNVAGVRDSIRDNVTGLLASDKKEYIENIRKLLKHTSLRQELGKNCRTWASLFSWNKTVKVYKEIINKIFKSESLLSDKVYPWDLDISSEAVTSLVSENTK